MDRYWKKATDVKLDVDQLLQTQRDITNVIADHCGSLHGDATRARRNVTDLQSFYEAARNDRQNLIDSYTRVIDVLYESYLEQFITLHSLILCRCMPIFDEKLYKELYKERLWGIGCQLHPKPLPPSRRGSTVQFADAASIAESIKIIDPCQLCDSECELSSPPTDRVSIFRFSNGLQTTLDRMGLVPSHGLVDVDDLLTKLPTDVHQQLTQEYDNLRPLGPILIGANNISELHSKVTSYHETDSGDDNNEVVQSTSSDIVSNDDTTVDNNSGDDGRGNSSCTIGAVGQVTGQ